MFSTISSSSTATIDPPDATAVATASSPSAGLPIASDRAIVLGRTGATFVPSANASATGEQPSACAPINRGCAPSTRPSSRSSLKPWCTFENIAPDAIGATTASGNVQPSCSAISKPSVFEPSA